MVNRGSDKEARYVRAAQLAKRLFRPDIIVRTIELGSATAALKEMREPSEIAHLLTVPEFRIVHPERGTPVAKGVVTVTLEVEANPDPVQDCDIFVNGRQAPCRRAGTNGGVHVIGLGCRQSEARKKTWRIF